MRATCISDLHLESVHGPTFEALVTCVENTIDDERDLYVLGDLVEVWIGDDDTSELCESLRDLFSRFAQKQSLYVMHGNRDFLIGDKFCRDVSATLLPDPYVIRWNSEKLLLSHGDCLCIDDDDYQRLKVYLRSDVFQSQFLSQSLEERRVFARSMREQSEAATSNKAEAIMDVNSDEVVRLMTEFDSRILIHGHTHRPGIHQISGDKLRYVLGDWSNHPWALNIDNDSIDLIV